MEAVNGCNVCQSELVYSLDPDWNLCRCSDCGYVFDSPRPGPAELVDFYSQPTKYDHWLAAEHARDLLWKRRLKKLLPHSRPGNLLDIGAGIGQFLHHARPFFTSVHGTEVSASAVRIAREKYGLALQQGYVEELDLPAAGFDNITVIHVLEHVPDPRQLVQVCGCKLRPGGTLVIAVPNDVLAWTSRLRSAGKRLGFAAFQHFSPVLGISKAGSSCEIHLSHFTPSILRRLLVDHGFNIVEESVDPFYAESGLKLAAHAGYYGFHRAIFKVSRKNWYDTIWMVARKLEANQ